MSVFRRYALRWALLMGILIIFGGYSQAGTHYVSPTGSAAWASCANISTPCSWGTAMSSAVAGDLVYFRGGTYNLGTFANHPSMVYTKMYPAHSGTGDADNQRIIFKAYPGEVPVVTGTVAADSQETWFGCGTSNYVTWDGFKSTIQINSGSYETAVFGAYGDYCTIKNSEFVGVNVGTRSYNSSFIRVEGATNAVVQNNYFHDLSGSAVNTTAVWIFASTDTHVRNNTMVNCSNGVMQKTGPNLRNRIYLNFMYNLNYAGVFLNEQASTGEDCRVFQNVIVNAYSGSSYGAIMAAGVSSSNTTNNYQIYNNTIYGSGLGIATSNYSRGLAIWNNIIYGAGTPYVRYYTGSALPSYANYNNFYRAGGGTWNANYSTNYSAISAWRTATSLDAASMTDNPQLVNPGGSAANDYQLSASSPYRGVGRNGENLGAFLTDDTVVGYVSGRLNSPSGFRITSN